MGRPQQTHSATFFTWLRLAYPQLKLQLIHAVTLLKSRVLSWEMGFIKKVRGGESVLDQKIFFLAGYVHLLDLQTLFEFVIPAIQDYGVSLRGDNWVQFWNCYLRLLVLYLSCSSKGIVIELRVIMMIRCC